MNIIASIHDKWFQLIKSGEKTIEVRKNVPLALRFYGDISLNPIQYIYWYNTKTKTIDGRSRFIDIFSLEDEIKIHDEWEELYSKQTCLSYVEAEDYLVLNFGFLWYLGEFEPLDIKLPEGKRPPQSWCYKDTIFHPLIAINPNFNKE